MDLVVVEAKLIQLVVLVIHVAVGVVAINLLLVYQATQDIANDHHA